MYSAHIWLRSIQWNTMALTAVLREMVPPWLYWWDCELRLRTYPISRNEQMRMRKPKVFIMEIFSSSFFKVDWFLALLFFKVDLLLIPSLSVLFWSELLVVVSRSLQAVNHYCYVAIFSRFMDIVKIFLNHKGWLWKGWLAIATLKPTFTFLVGILPSKSIEYGKIPTKKSESWF